MLGDHIVFVRVAADKALVCDNYAVANVTVAGCIRAMNRVPRGVQKVTSKGGGTTMNNLCLIRGGGLVFLFCGWLSCTSAFADAVTPSFTPLADPDGFIVPIR